MRLFWSNDSLAGRRGRRTRAENDAKITWASPCALSARICASKFHAMAQGHCVPPTSFCSHLPLDFYPYVLSNFRHFYARKGGTLKWRHRVVAYGCGYSEITVSVYASRSPRLSSYLPITHFSCNPFVYLVYRTISFCIAHLPSSRMVLRFLMPFSLIWKREEREREREIARVLRSLYLKINASGTADLPFRVWIPHGEAWNVYASGRTVLTKCLSNVW